MSSNEYNQLLKFLYFEGYVDSYAEAEELLESMSDEEFEDLLEKHSFPLKPSERRSVENMGRMLGGDYSVPPGGSARSRSAKKVEPEPQEKSQPRKRTTDLKEVRMGEDFDAIVEYLFVEGFADTIENAELMAESISENWVNEIMEAYVDLNTKAGEMRRRANRTLFVKGDWDRANKIDTAREKHDPAKVQAKAAENRRRGEQKRQQR